LFEPYYSPLVVVKGGYTQRGKETEVGVRPIRELKETSNIKLQTSNFKHQTSNFKHQTSNFKEIPSSKHQGNIKPQTNSKPSRCLRGSVLVRPSYGCGGAQRGEAATPGRRNWIVAMPS
jgi:hypothetical protein